jgi:hypothetical protein
MKRKKIVLIVSSIVIGLILILGGFFTWYLLFRSTSKKAYREAVDYINNGDYYQFTDNGTIKIKTEFPDYSEYNDDNIEILNGEGKVDIQNKLKYKKYTEEKDNEGVITHEVYFEQDNVYIKSQDGKFEKVQNLQNVNELFDNIFSEAIKSEDFEVLNNEDVDGEKCYHYKITIDKNEIQEISRLFLNVILRDLQDSSNLDIFIEKNDIDLWISKEKSKIVKFYINFENVHFSEENNSVIMNIRFDISYSIYFNDWGGEVYIEIPNI